VATSISEEESVPILFLKSSCQAMDQNDFITASILVKVRVPLSVGNSSPYASQPGLCGNPSSIRQCSHVAWQMFVWFREGNKLHQDSAFVTKPCQRSEAVFNCGEISTKIELMTVAKCVKSRTGSILGVGNPKRRGSLPSSLDLPSVIQDMHSCVLRRGDNKFWRRNPRPNRVLVKTADSLMTNGSCS
jgi:hypothetical protein